MLVRILNNKNMSDFDYHKLGGGPAKVEPEDQLTDANGRRIEATPSRNLSADNTQIYANNLTETMEDSNAL